MTIRYIRVQMFACRAMIVIMKAFQPSSPSRIRFCFLAICSAAVLFVAGCVTNEPKVNPFKVPSETIRATVKTIAVFPVLAPFKDKKLESVQAEFEGMIDATLRAGGFTVIESSRVAPILATNRQAVGGVFDPQTGKRDEAKFQTYWQHALQDIHTNFNADAILLCNIVHHTLDFRGRSALASSIHWDGASDSLFSGGGTFADFMLSGGQYSGRVGGLSLRVCLQDLQSHDLFVNYGGIQLTSRLTSGFGRSEFKAISPDELLVDPLRNQNAVNFALDPLVKQPPFLTGQVGVAAPP